MRRTQISEATGRLRLLLNPLRRNMIRLKINLMTPSNRWTITATNTCLKNLNTKAARREGDRAGISLSLNKRLSSENTRRLLSLEQMLGITADTVGGVGDSFTPPPTAASAPTAHTQAPSPPDSDQGRRKIVDLYDVMRTTFAAREFTDESLPDRVLYRILDNARFAPSGGNRQAAHIIVVRDQQTRDRLAELSVPGAQRYVAQLGIGEAPWNPISPSGVRPADVDTTNVPDTFIAPLRGASVVLVVCLDLRCVAATDQGLSRIGVVSGASVYPLVWNILLAARGEG